MGEEVYQPVKRIRQACQNCRRKKVRCSGTRPVCTFCSHLGQPCHYNDNDDELQRSASASSEDHHATSSVRLKEDIDARLGAIEAQLSQVVDLVKSTAAELTANFTAAIRSMQNNEGPGSADRATGSARVAGPATTSRNKYERLPPDEVLSAAVDIYFRFCHNQPYSLFHEGSFKARLERQELPTHLIFAMLANIVRYSDDIYFDDKIEAVSTYAQQSWKGIVMPWNGLQSDAQLSVVQTILLLAIIDYTDGRTQASWIKVGLAIRLAQGFNLMIEPDSSLPPVQQEERRRVFWSFYVCDKLISCGNHRPAAILDEHCRLHLPCDEGAWRRSEYQETLTIDKVPGDDPAKTLASLGPFALSTVMASLLGQCASYTLGEQEEAGSTTKVPAWNPQSRYSSLHSALIQLESELGFSDSLANKIVQLYSLPDGTIDQQQAAPLVLAHALFHLCQCLLYHPYLLKRRIARAGSKAPPSFLTQAFVTCRIAAEALTKLMDDVKSLCCDTLTTSFDPFYGYCTTVAGTIHVLFSNDMDLKTVQSSQSLLLSSLANLEELSVYWKSCSMMRNRLEHFSTSKIPFRDLIDPKFQGVSLGQDEIQEMTECLDYSIMSTTVRRRSQAATRLIPVSQLPSPFYDEFLSLLPFDQLRAATNDMGLGVPTADQFDQFKAPVDPLNYGSFVTGPNTSSQMYTQDHTSMRNGSVSDGSPQTTHSTYLDLVNQHNRQSAFNSYGNSTSPPRAMIDGSTPPDRVMNAGMNGLGVQRRLSMALKRPWYETDTQNETSDEPSPRRPSSVAFQGVY